MATDSFNVLDMAKEMAEASGTPDIGEFFRNNPVSGKVKAEKEAEESGSTTTPEEHGENTPGPVNVVQKKKGEPWRPSAEAMADLPELQSHPVTYSKEELKEEEDTGLKNIADENAIQESREAMDDLTRKQANIEEAKARHGFDKLQIPPGQFQADIYMAAGDPLHKRAQENLDKLFNNIKEHHPEFIMTWLPGFGPNPPAAPTGLQDQMAGELPEIPAETPPQADSAPVEGAVIHEDDEPERPDVKVIIDKRNVSKIAWSQEEVDKIRRARTVQLNIVEAKDLPFASIEKVKPNAVDKVLEQFQRKTNDIDTALPASRYRATFTGLSFPEVMDLSNSTEMNSLDGERVKWSICFRHIRNQSIGPWETWRYYYDHETGEKVRIDPRKGYPEEYSDDEIFTHTKFDDFLSKTSWMDLEFMLWKILCATAMDKELISIDCHAKFNGKPCNKSYDWIYSPNELLMLDTVDPAVLEEMKTTGELLTPEEIMKNYMEGPLMADNAVLLPSSGYQLLFGHISGEDYLGGIYGEIKKYEDEKAMDTDPTFVSHAMNASNLTIVKGFLLPKADGSGWLKITGIENIVKILGELDEVDWLVVDEISRMMVQPYQFAFALRDIVCPQCGNRSTIPIDSMSRLLFIVARSLSSVQVELKRT